MQSLSTVPYGTYYIIIRTYIWYEYNTISSLQFRQCDKRIINGVPTYVLSYILYLQIFRRTSIWKWDRLPTYVRTYETRYIYSDDIETKENCNYGTSCMYVRIRYHTVALKRIKSLIKQKYTYLGEFTYVHSHKHQHKQTAKRRFPELSRKFDQEL